MGAQRERPAALEKAGHVTARLGLQWLMASPLAASILWLAPISYNTNGLIGDWYGLVYYGALCSTARSCSALRMLAALNRQRWLSVAVGSRPMACSMSSSSTAPYGRIADADRPVYALLSGVNTMAWLFAIIGFANRHLTSRRHSSVSRPKPSILLHPAPDGDGDRRLLAAQIGAPPLAGFILAVLVTFLGTSAIYFGLVRPLWFIRSLFGLKAAGRHPVVMRRQPG